MLNNNQFSQDSISHKELQRFLKLAKKDITPIDFSDKIKEDEDFSDLIQSWTETSKKLLQKLGSKDKFLSKNKNSKTLMALGAMGAHITMALQALKATECDQ